MPPELMLNKQWKHTGYDLKYTIGKIFFKNLKTHPISLHSSAMYIKSMCVLKYKASVRTDSSKEQHRWCIPTEKLLDCNPGLVKQ